jgi:hypothetical protein
MASTGTHATKHIVSDTGSASYRVAQHINYHLEPLSTIDPAYLKDTYDFFNKIRFQLYSSPET